MARRQIPGRLAPSADEIEALARAAMARLPAEFAAHLDGVALLVEEFADAATLAAVGLDDPFDLTGLYDGRPIGDKSSADPIGAPDTIHLYRRAILEEWIEDGETLEHLVAHVLIHEVGHHFGLSDAAMHALEAE